MRLFSRVAALTLAVMIAAVPEQSVAQDGITGLTFQGLLLRRDDIGDTDFTGPDTVGDPFISFNAEDLDAEWSGGFRVGIEGRLWGMRLSYGVFAAWPFETNETRFDRNEDGTNATYDDDAHLNPGADVNTTNSDDLFALEVEHRTTLIGTDARTLYAVAPGVDVFWGTSSLYVDERLKSIAYDEPNDFDGADNGIDRVRIESENVLTGLQIGVQGDVPVAQGISFGGSLRGGLMANFIDVKRSFSSDDDANNRISNNIDDTAFAQFVEAMPRLSVAITPNVDLTAAGQVLYIHGLSLATDYYRTVTDSDDRRIRDDGDALFYGGSLGVRIKLN